ncbi:MAG: tRNA preQ1(34) S-adenosylmethionine ribosyltransferase-isomerase QueA [Luteitalea sp.]|nr:tRNA preQ1(34) S-adenosylmethionine ribosyltransferase-isomerase QueA [Luteitalea sp.]
MDIRDFAFDLPRELIAQEPAVEREAARLLQLRREDGSMTHQRVSDLPTLLRSGDLIVVNKTRVFPARLLGHRVPTGGGVECLLIARLDPVESEAAPEERWEALMHPGQKLKPGAAVTFPGRVPLLAEVIERRFFGRRVIRLWTGNGSPVRDAIDAIGHVPLPPYIRRDDRFSDRERYQTVFAEARGSVAAPTAGLHFTPGLVDALRARGVTTTSITLHIGYGTFQPVRVRRIEEHRLEPERFEIEDAAARAINDALSDRRRVIAVGTTTTRTLEAVGRAHDGSIAAGAGSTDLFIYPGFRFRVIRGLITNFHLPQSSLLMLVAAFAGTDCVLAAYREAVAARYRFYSYGDAMLIV